MKASNRWHTKILTRDLRNWDVAGAGRVSTHSKRAAQILNGATYATLFAYLWRRFGPPEHGWDDHKELVRYYLTTPVEGIGFGINCCPCGLKYSFAYAISPIWRRRIEEYELGAVDRWYRGLKRHCICDGWATWNEGPYFRSILCDMVAFESGRESLMGSVAEASSAWQARVRRLVREYRERAGDQPRHRWVEESRDIYGEDLLPIDQLPRSPHRTILEAIEAGVRDLLRPVNVRDTYINACGKVDDVAVFRPVRPSPRAGCGCSPDFIDAGDAWWDLAARIRELGVNIALAKLSS